MPNLSHFLKIACLFGFLFGPTLGVAAEGENEGSCTTRDLESFSLVGNKAVYWKNGSALRVRFMNGDEALRSKVLEVAQEWSKSINITFVRVNDGDSDIRVRFGDGTDSGNWSYLGTQANQQKGKHTMYLESVTSVNSGDANIQRKVLHEFGHALGFEHEHMNPAQGIQWDTEKVYEYYEKQGWSRTDVDHNLFQKLAQNKVNSSAYDRYSIMHYPIEKGLTYNGYWVPWNNSLSATDRSFAAAIYPKKEFVDTVILDENVYTARSRYNNRCLDVRDHSTENGAVIQQWDCTGEEQQMFRLTRTRGDMYRFQGLGSQKCITAPASGGTITQADCNGTPEQDLRLTKNLDGSFGLVFAHSDKCLSLSSNSWSNGLEMTQSDCKSDDDTQSWLLKVWNQFSGIRTDQFYNLISNSGRKCLDIKDHSMDLLAPLQQWDCTGEPHQLFAFVYQGDGLYSISSPHSYKCLTLESMNIDDGVQVMQYDCHEKAPDQLVRFEFSGNGYYRIVFANSNKCMDIEGAGDQNGQLMKQAQCTGGKNQEWLPLVQK